MKPLSKNDQWSIIVVGILLGLILGYLGVSHVKTDVIDVADTCISETSVGCVVRKGTIQKGWPLIVATGETAGTTGNPYPENYKDVSAYPIHESRSLNALLDFTFFIGISIILVEGTYALVSRGKVTNGQKSPNTSKNQSR